MKHLFLILAFVFAGSTWATDIRPGAPKVDGTTIENAAGIGMRVKDGGITPAKLSARNYAAASSSGTFSTATATPWGTQVTNQSISLVSNGRPIFVTLVPAGNSSTLNAEIGAYYAGGGVEHLFGFTRNDGVTGDYYHNIMKLVSTYTGATTAFVRHPCSLLTIFEPVTVSGRTYTFKLYAWGAAASSSVVVSNCRMIAFEL